MTPPLDFPDHLDAAEPMRVIAEGRVHILLSRGLSAHGVKWPVGGLLCGRISAGRRLTTAGVSCPTCQSMERTLKGAEGR